ncbi:MAG: hypothetical protein UR26_C0001G0150 [candidate division TM6 bacterium GW2011_GWF2_32_72]|nr:MAG: hypothetical protein UR26_C0001G0150 [candidate division TM6 bacterium GW2011_GWF2_32_72]
MKKIICLFLLFATCGCLASEPLTTRIKIDKYEFPSCEAGISLKIDDIEKILQEEFNQNLVKLNNKFNQCFLKDSFDMGKFYSAQERLLSLWLVCWDREYHALRRQSIIITQEEFKNLELLRNLLKKCIENCETWSEEEKDKYSNDLADLEKSLNWLIDWTIYL